MDALGPGCCHANALRIAPSPANRHPSVMSSIFPSYKRHRFPPEIIAHAVWLYFRFGLSLRAVEEMLLESGIEVTCETLRGWVIKFGPSIANGLRRRTCRPGEVWHLDEVRVTLRGEAYWLWRAFDQNGLVLDEILERRRDSKAAKRLLKSLLKKAGCRSKRIITDKPGSYGAARRALSPGLEHRSHKGLSNGAENSHLPFRSREWVMRGHRTPGGLQRFVSMHSATRNCLVPLRHRRSAQSGRYHRIKARGIWREAAGLTA